MRTHSSCWLVLALLAAALCVTSAHAERFFAVTGDTGEVEAIDTTGAKAWLYGSPDIEVSRNGLHFNVYVMDIRNNTHAGFALDAPTGAEARARLTEVLEYIADVLNERGTLDLLVKESASLGSGFEVFGGTYFTANTSSQAGAALYRLRMGVKQSADLPDMFLTVDFGGCFNFGADAPGALELDFYSLLLHGLTHSLGVASLMDRSGASTVSPGIYSEWDWHVVQGRAAAHLIDGNPPGFATFVGDAGDLTCGDLAFDGPEAISRHGSMPKIYAPLLFAPGASICHWGEDIANGAVLERVTPLGAARRRWAPVDLGALTDIGYKYISEDAG
ncbi:MAG: hypothetical protein NTU83_14265, partial [Candidatus Hydrogenedentes bacterium]|nr:hypothetical protein [Candidatus Hydrogenedentota bacterium]